MLRGDIVEGRYYNTVMAALPDGEILFSSGTNDWQGCVEFVAKLDSGEYLTYGWSYGSCSGCDAWSALYEYDSYTKSRTEAEVTDLINLEIQTNAKTMSASVMLAYLEQNRNSLWLKDEPGSYSYESRTGLTVAELLAKVKADSLLEA
jgi:hypothetical protein